MDREGLASPGPRRREGGGVSRQTCYGIRVTQPISLEARSVIVNAIAGGALLDAAALEAGVTMADVRAAMRAEPAFTADIKAATAARTGAPAPGAPTVPESPPPPPPAPGALGFFARYDGSCDYAVIAKDTDEVTDSGVCSPEELMTMGLSLRVPVGRYAAHDSHLKSFDDVAAARGLDVKKVQASSRLVSAGHGFTGYDSGSMRASSVWAAISARESTAPVMPVFRICDLAPLLTATRDAPHAIVLSTAGPLPSVGALVLMAAADAPEEQQRCEVVGHGELPSPAGPLPCVLLACSSPA